MNSRKMKLAMVVGVIAMTSVPAAASAVSSETSYQGSDYSRNYTSGTAILACNVEVDGHEVSADYYRAGTGTMYYLIDGSEDGNCASTSTSTVIHQHRAVELLPGTDAYGPWVYPV